MINPQTASMLAHYKGWADQLLYDSLAALPAEEIVKQRAGPLKSILNILNHVYVVDRIWQAHLLRGEHGIKSRMEIPFPDPLELRQAQEAMNAWFVTWAAQQTEASLGEAWEFAFLSGQRGVMSAGSMFLHAVNHATFHRGWITQLFFEIPAPPPVTDLCVYLTEVHGDPLQAC